VCNCIRLIEDNTKKEHNADLAHFEHFGHQSSEVGYASYKKGNNHIFSKRYYTSVPWKFCPFCGEPLEQ